MGPVDWLLLGFYLFVIHWAATTNTNPSDMAKARLARIRSEGGANIPVRHERKRDKRTVK